MTILMIVAGFMVGFAVMRMMRRRTTAAESSAAALQAIFDAMPDANKQRAFDIAIERRQNVLRYRRVHRFAFWFGLVVPFVGLIWLIAR